MRIGYGVLAALVLTAELAYGATKMKITSPDFEPDGFIPMNFTCQGKDINPSLYVNDVPASTKSLALIVDDPDAPMGAWVHWVVYDIPASANVSVTENSIPGKEGWNNFGRTHYGGPCPPSGKHRYFFKIYALDAILNVSGKVDKKSLERAMQGHILDEAKLVGVYKKQ